MTVLSSVKEVSTTSKRVLFGVLIHYLYQS